MAPIGQRLPKLTSNVGSICLCVKNGNSLWGRHQKRRISKLACSNTIAINYAPLPSGKRPSLLTKDGLMERACRWKQKFLNFTCLVKLKSDLPGFNSKNFLTEMSDLYITFNERVSKGDISTIKDRMTSHFYSKIKNEAKRNPIQPVYWQFEGFVTPPKAMSMAAIHIPALGTDLEYYQIVVRFDSLQKIHSLPYVPLILRKELSTRELYNLVKRDKEEKDQQLERVTEYYAVEKNVADERGGWKLMAKVEESDEYFK